MQSLIELLTKERGLSRREALSLIQDCRDALEGRQWEQVLQDYLQVGIEYINEIYG